MSQDLDALKREICDIGRRAWDKGMGAANDGNITVLLDDGTFLCTPTNTSKGFMTPDMICRIDRTGAPVEESRWKPSHAKKDVKADDEEWTYVGTWAVEEPSVLKGMEGDKGLVLKDKAAHHAISAKFPKVIDNKGNTLVVQYEVKLQGTWQLLGGRFLGQHTDVI